MSEIDWAKPWSELTYFVLLLLAVAGVWVLRSRPVLMTIALLLLPLPPALLRYFEAPRTAIEKPHHATAQADTSHTSGDKNATAMVHIDAPRPAGGGPVEAAPRFEGGRRVDQELPSAAPQQQDDPTAFLNASLFLVSTVVTYLSVWLGVAAGLIVYRILAGERFSAEVADEKAKSAELRDSGSSSRRRSGSSRRIGNATSLLDRVLQAEPSQVASARYTRSEESANSSSIGSVGIPDG